MNKAPNVNFLHFTTTDPITHHATQLKLGGWLSFLVGNFQRFMKVCGHGHSRNNHKSCLFFQILEQIMWYEKEVWILFR